MADNPRGLIQPPIKNLNWFNYRFIQEDGYGQFGMYFIEALARNGVNVSPATVDLLRWPAWLRMLGGLDETALNILLMPSYELLNVGNGRVWNFTMWESTRLPDRWHEPANRIAERVLVPHQCLVEVFKESGIKVPIHVVPGGVCPTRFQLAPQSPYESGRPYTFLALGDRSYRKGWDLVWNCFGEEFRDEKDVRLIIKARRGGLQAISQAHWDRRVTFIRDDVPSMAEVYALADCFVFPTRFEGWGMPCRQFAMTGKPVIVTKYGATDDETDEWAYPLVDNIEVDSILPGDGKWAFPSRDEIRAKMRHCYENRDEAREKGRKASQWLRANRTWDHAALKLLELIREHL